VNEPSIVAINKATGEVVAVGREAKEMLVDARRETFVAIKPMKDGVDRGFQGHGKDADVLSSRRRTTGACWYTRASSLGCRAESRRGKSARCRTPLTGRAPAKFYLVGTGHGRAIARGCPIEEPQRKHGGGYWRRHHGHRGDSMSGIGTRGSVRVAGNEMGRKP